MTHSVVYSAPEHHPEPGTLREGISSVDVPGSLSLPSNLQFATSIILISSSTLQLRTLTRPHNRHLKSQFRERSPRSTGQYRIIFILHTTEVSRAHIFYRLPALGPLLLFLRSPESILISGRAEAHITYVHLNLIVSQP